MKQFVLSIALIALFYGTFAQNKTLSVGTTTPNPNAALHVESPTNNQGAILPRLTTAQRTAMAGILGATDAGILLYDSDLKALFIWDGNSWESSAKLAMPFKDSVFTATGTTDLFALKYNNAENKRVMRIESLNKSNGSSALSVSNNSSGLGLYVQNTNDTSSVSTVYVANNSNNVSIPGPAGVYSEATGLGGAPGSFRVINPGNNRSAIYAETLGNGTTLTARQNGTNGNAAFFHVINAGNNGSSVYARNDGTGTAINALTTGSGYAGSFEVTNVANTNPAVMVQTAGLGSAIQANHSNGGLALDINVGGIKNSIVTESTPGVLTTRAGVINIDVAGTYELSTAGRVDGETIIITNSTSPVNLVRIQLDVNYVVDLQNEFQTATFVFVNGTWRGTGAFAP